MEIISITRPGEETIRVWVQDRDAGVYRHYELGYGRFEEIMTPVRMREYANYNHFIGVMGKFAPEIEFFEKPVPIAKLHRDIIMDLIVKRGIGLMRY